MIFEQAFHIFRQNGLFAKILNRDSPDYIQLVIGTQMIHDLNANIDIITQNILSITHKDNDLWFVYSHDDDKFIYESTDFDLVIQFALEFYSKKQGIIL